MKLRIPVAPQAEDSSLNMKLLFWKLMSSIAGIALPLWRLGQTMAWLPLRFGRLVRLRAACLGTIPPTTQLDGPVRTAGRASLRLGEHCRLGRDVYFETVDSGRIEIGSYVRINAGCMLVARTRILIGNDSLIGEYSSIRDSDHGIEPGVPIRIQPHRSASIIIGADVWIGRGTVILKGVSIGDGSVIGANSVVNKDVPAGVIAAGIPARVIRFRGSSQQPAETV
ncbi:MAG: acyltransferase [Phycisphaerae bacterium]|nr:acyltransferase [Phycisphaerae bacterium]